MDCVYISEGNYLWKHNDAVIDAIHAYLLTKTKNFFNPYFVTTAIT